VEKREPAGEILSAAKDLKLWWALQDLNLGPTDYESAALTAELRARLQLLEDILLRQISKSNCRVDSQSKWLTKGRHKERKGDRSDFHSLW
jgi:hypothetical protein